MAKITLYTVVQLQKKQQLNSAEVEAFAIQNTQTNGKTILNLIEFLSEEIYIDFPDLVFL